MKQRSRKALAKLPHNGTDEKFHSFPGTVSLQKGYKSRNPRTLLCLQDFCILSSLVFAYNVFINKNENGTLTELGEKMVCLLELEEEKGPTKRKTKKKLKKCEVETAVKAIQMEVTKLQKLKNLPLEPEKQTFDIIVPKIADLFNCNVLVHECSDTDQILYQYPRYYQFPDTSIFYVTHNYLFIITVPFYYS